jgi:hypothetical protein
VTRYVLSFHTRHKRTLYFAEAIGASMIKIGITSDLGARLRALRDASPVPLALLHSLPGTARQESALHLKFIAARSHAEWFRATDELRAFIERLKIASAIEIGHLFRHMPAQRLNSRCFQQSKVPPL